MRIFFLTALTLSLLMSCQNLVRNRTVTTASDADFAALETFENKILTYRLKPSDSTLKDLKKEARALTEKDTLSKSYLAQSWGLLGEIYTLELNTNRVEEAALNIEKYDPSSERLVLLRVWQAQDAVKKNKILERELGKNPHQYRLLLEKGLLYYNAGDYRTAAASLDEALNHLSPGYQKLYNMTRDSAFQLINGGPTVKSSKEWINKPVLSIEGLIVLTSQETRYLEPYLRKKTDDPATISRELIQKGLLLPGSTPLTKSALRKDAAFLIFQLALRLEKRLDLTNAYQLKYSAQTGSQSPIPDVSISDPCFDSALGTIEREIFDLPDGRRFEPDRSLSGMDYLKALNKLKKLYP